MKITTIGLDIAKAVFHLFAVSKTGRLVKKKQFKRQQVNGRQGRHPLCTWLWALLSSGKAIHHTPGPGRQG